MSIRYAVEPSVPMKRLNVNDPQTSTDYLLRERPSGVLISPILVGNAYSVACGHCGAITKVPMDEKTFRCHECYSLNQFDAST